MALGASAHIDSFCRDRLPAAEDQPQFCYDLPELDYPDRLNCAQVLLAATAERLGAERPCLQSPTERWSYGDTVRIANQVAHVLADDYGLVPGNRVLLRGPNSPWLAACWLGVVMAGGVAVATMPLLRGREIAAVCEIAHIDLALCDHRFVDDLAAAALPGMRIMRYGGSAADDLATRAAAQPAAFEAVDTAADDVALLAFTSGTTGRPKATMHFHRDVLACADTFSAQILKPLPDDVFVGSPPLAFTFGLGGHLIFPLRVGAAALLLERTTPDVLADAIVAHGATVCFTAPTALRAMLASGRAAQLRGRLRRAVSAGEHLSSATWQAFYDATGVKIIDGIGSTEMLHIFIAAADEDIRPGSTGRPVPGYEARVVDDDGQPVPDGTIGRLAVRGPTGCRYLADERQRVYVHNGWNLTGDTYLRDSEGYFWYQARTDDMIVSSGYNIAAPEVEDALLAHPDVAECGVVGVPDEARGQLITAYVVLTGGVVGDDTKVKELQEFAKAQIAPYKYPRAIHFVAALPRTGTGKLQRFRLHDLPAYADAPPR
jgi:2-aminobenzoate-CoA ligase